MEPSTQTSDGPERQAPPASPSPAPTPQGATDTPLQSAALITHSFHPTVATDIDEKLAATAIINVETIVDGYVILQEIGRGGMGVVFKAKQPATGQTVALKMIRDGVFADPEAIERFRQEIKTLGQLQPVKNIVPIYHVGQYKDESYFVMPYLTGGSLSTHLKRFQKDRRKAVALVELIARAVHQLHLQKILHRDIKPGNILLNADDEPFLSDFGLIKLLDNEQSMTRTAQQLGTPPYMAPEQTGLLSTLTSAQTDIWSLGVLLYEALTGSRPFFSRKGEETSTLFWKIVHEAPPSLRTLQPDLDAGLEAVVFKCLEKRPEDRHASAEELADELGRWLRGQTPLTRPVGRGRRLWRSAAPRWRLVAALLVLPLVVVAAIYPFRNHLGNKPAPTHENLRSLFSNQTSVALIDGKNPPLWSEWTYKDSGTLGRSKDGYNQISSESLGMLVLAKDLPTKAYRLRAKIRHDVANSMDCEVGLFAGFGDYSNGVALTHLFFPCVFNDIQDAKELEREVTVPPIKIEGNQFYLEYHILAEIKPNDYESRRPKWIKPVIFKPAGLAGGVWREVSLEVYPDRLIASFDQRSTPAMPLATAKTRLDKEFTDFLVRKVQPPHHMETNFRPNGSIGILVDRGIASITDVVIEHLPVPQP